MFFCFNKGQVKEQNQIGAIVPLTEWAGCLLEKAAKSSSIETKPYRNNKTGRLVCWIMAEVVLPTIICRMRECP